MHLFHERGFSQTSMSDIGSAVGITAGSIYQHWRDKQDILDAAVLSGAEELLKRVQGVAEAIDDPGERLVAMLDEVIAFVTDNVALAAVARHDRALASDRCRYKADRADGVVLAELVHALVRARRDLSEREARATIHAALGMVYSLTHTQPSLDTERVGRYLRRAARAVVAPSFEAETGPGSAQQRTASKGAKNRT